MVENVPDTVWTQLSRRIEEVLGIVFPPNRRNDLIARLTPAAKEFGFDDVGACAAWLLSTPLSRAQIAVLAKHLTVGETYFFRDAKSFDALRTKIFPDIFTDPHREQREVRVWCAAASTGEEPYSVAILLRQIMPPEWRARIFATDINESAIERAKTGIYREWSFRQLPAGYREKYFSPVSDDRHQIAPEIRRMVTFFPFNLVADVFPSFLKGLVEIDVILCRNVLIYFSAQTNAEIIGKMEMTLAPGGYLLVSPAEAPHVALPSLLRLNIGSVVCFRRAHPASPQKPASAPLKTAPKGSAGKISSEKSARLKLRGASPPQPRVMRRALAAYRRGNYAAVTALLENFLSADDGALTAHPDALQLLVYAHANQKDLAAAEAWCQRAIERDKVNPLYHYLLAMVLLAKKDEAAARDALKRAVFLDQNFVMAHFSLGNLYHRWGDVEAARRQYRILQKLLQNVPPNAPLPGSDELTADTLRQMTENLLSQ